MNIFQLKNKTIFSLVAFFCGGLFGLSLFLQYYVLVVPCSLCIVQRFMYLFIGFVAFGAYWTATKNASVQVYGLLILTLSVFGEAIAARQVWIAAHPSLIDPTKCLLSIGSFLHSVIISLGGVGNCADQGWTLFGFSLPEWSLFCFFILLVTGAFLVLRPRFKDKNYAE